MPEHRHLIICGAEKAGTTSLYTYLAAHPDVVSSMHKESDFFRNTTLSYDSYLTCFPPSTPANKLLMESSPGYMAEFEAVAPRIAAIVPRARLVFLLRDPIDRLRSSFRFYKSRLHLPEQMNFETFVQHCFAFEVGGRNPAEIGLGEWHLRSLARGRYDAQIVAFERCLPPSQLLLVHYDSLRDDVRQCVARIATFAGLDPRFFDGFEFGRENVTFLAKHRGIQHFAIQVNDGLEGLWRRNPALKKRLLRLYKRFNERALEPDALSETTLAQLRQWYAPTQALLDRVRHPVRG